MVRVQLVTYGRALLSFFDSVHPLPSPLDPAITITIAITIIVIIAAIAAIAITRAARGIRVAITAATTLGI